MITQIFLNLFIAIIIDAFMGVSESFELPVSQMALEEFAEIWSLKYDPNGTSFMPTKRLEELLIDLSKTK